MTIDGVRTCRFDSYRHLNFMTNNKRIRQILWEKNPNCCYCGIKTKLTNCSGGGALSDNEATIEHINSRYSLERHLLSADNQEIPKAIACYKCNNEKVHHDQRMFGHSKEAKISNQIFLLECKFRRIKNCGGSISLTQQEAYNILMEKLRKLIYGGI